MEQFIVQNQEQTRKLARLLAREILKYKKRSSSRGNHGALIFGLVGDLGAGKTTFIQAFAKGLRIKGRLTSPSFVLMKKYRALSVHKNFYHVDCYRIKSPKDMLTLDFKEIISNPKNIIMIEWAEKIKKILPRDTIWIRFKIISEKERIISVK
jgi:tRNA threonylcarbamoyladenosine biosynthesis protein TsaE